MYCVGTNHLIRLLEAFKRALHFDMMDNDMALHWGGPPQIPRSSFNLTARFNLSAKPVASIQPLNRSLQFNREAARFNLTA